jgi:hypothetical protein
MGNLVAEFNSRNAQFPGSAVRDLTAPAFEWFGLPLTLDAKCAGQPPHGRKTQKHVVQMWCVGLFDEPLGTDFGPSHSPDLRFLWSG